MWSLGISVEARLAVLTLAALRVVQTVTNASAALARLAPRRPVKMAALSVSIALTLWCEREEVSASATRTCRRSEGKISDLIWDQ